MDLVVDEWIVKDKNDLDVSSESIKLNGLYLLRNTGNTDSFVWVKICSNSPFERIKSSKIVIQSNARFVELYYVQDTVVEYLTTLRGGSGSDKFVFEIEHNSPLQFNQLHLKFLSIKNHSADQGPGLELKVKSVEVTIAQSSYDVANSNYVSRSAKRSDSGSSENSDATSTTNETTDRGTTPQGVEDNSSALDSQNSTSSTSPTSAPSGSGAAASATNGRPQRGMDVRQMILMSMNKPAPIPNINLSSPSPQTNEMMIQLMIQMKTSLLSDIGGLLDAKLLPIVNRLDKLETSVTELKSKLNNNSNSQKV